MFKFLNFIILITVSKKIKFKIIYCKLINQAIKLKLILERKWNISKLFKITG